MESLLRLLNEHYASISTDVNYQPSQLKLTAASCDSFISEAHARFPAARHIEVNGHRARRNSCLVSPSWSPDIRPALQSDDSRRYRTTAMENGVYHSYTESVASDYAE